MAKMIREQVEEAAAPSPGARFDRLQFGVQFVRLHRALTAADTLEALMPAARAMHEFLASLEAELRRDDAQARWLRPEFAKVLSILLTVMAEAGQYRHEAFSPSTEADRARREVIDSDLLPAAGELRKQAIAVAKAYLARPVFRSLWAGLEAEVYPLLDTLDPDLDPDRYMPFRVIQVGNIYERLYGFRLRTDEPYLMGEPGQPGLLQEIYNRKYLRFGTSGVRGRWGYDFTEARARQVAQAICDFLKNTDLPGYVGAESLGGKRLVVGYDSRRNADRVAQWVAQVCIANGFKVDLAYRETPTPALVYHLTDYLDPDEVAGLINCTASHNPPEWQGIKFNPRLGYPAPTNVTDFIAARINELQLLDEQARSADLAEAEASGMVRGFDPFSHYVRWILDSGRGDDRIPLDVERIRAYFAGRQIVVDEMYGAGRGYLPTLLGEIGVRYTVIHAERNPNLPGMDYANPEEPFIQPLKDHVRETGAALGLAMDTDADRFGIVDRGGQYFRPNQVLPMLIRYLGVDRGLTGRVIATQTGSPLIEPLAARIPNNQDNEPLPNVIPAYVDHPFYHRLIGEPTSRIYRHSFLVPVGIKYIEEQRRTDRAYHSLKALPESWRSAILIGGEESSGLTTRGHVTDKDGIWADLLVMDMLAYYGTQKGLDSIAAIWDDTTHLEGLWASYGWRVDVDAVLEAKEGLIDHYLDAFAQGAASPQKAFAGLQVEYAGGIRYDVVELQLRDARGDNRHFLRMRSSGTEPIIRIYVESTSPEVANRLVQTALDKLEDLSVQQIREARAEWRLVEVVSTTRLSPRALQAALEVIGRNAGWSRESLVSRLQRLEAALERRSRHTVDAWIEALSAR